MAIATVNPVDNSQMRDFHQAGIAMAATVDYVKYPCLPEMPSRESQQRAPTKSGRW